MKGLILFFIRPIFIVLYAGAAWYYLEEQLTTQIAEQVTPMDAQISAKEGELKTLKSKLNTGEAFRAERDKKLQELQELAKEFQGITQQLPKQPSVSELLKVIGGLIDRTGLDLLSLKPQPIKRQEVISEIPVQVQVRGNYLKVMSFIDSVAYLKRVMRVDKVTFDTAEFRQTESDIKADLNIVAYFFEGGGG